MCNQVLQFFIQVLNNDQDLLLQVEVASEEIYMQQSSLVFSLKGLFDFLLDNQLLTKTMSYSEFKKMLYNSHLNHKLQQHKGIIEVYHSTSKINTSLYCLCKKKD